MNSRCLPQLSPRAQDGVMAYAARSTEIFAHESDGAIGRKLTPPHIGKVCLNVAFHADKARRLL